jgi:hypothetical protein
MSGLMLRPMLFADASPEQCQRAWAASARPRVLTALSALLAHPASSLRHLYCDSVDHAAALVAPVLADSLSSWDCRLETLSLRQVLATTGALDTFGALFKINMHLTELRLDGCTLTRIGLQTLTHGVAVNRTLRILSLVDSRLGLPDADADADADRNAHVVEVGTGESEGDRIALIAALVQACAGSTSCQQLNLSGVSELSVVGVTTCLRVLQDHAARGAVSAVASTAGFVLGLLRTLPLPKLSFAMASVAHCHAWLSAIWSAYPGVHAADSLPSFSIWWEQTPSCGPLSANGEASVWSDVEIRWVWALSQALSPVQLIVNPLQTLDQCFGARFAK